MTTDTLPTARNLTAPHSPTLAGAPTTARWVAAGARHGGHRRGLGGRRGYRVACAWHSPFLSPAPPPRTYRLGRCRSSRAAAPRCGAAGCRHAVKPTCLLAPYETHRFRTPPPPTGGACVTSAGVVRAVGAACSPPPPRTTPSPPLDTSPSPPPALAINTLFPPGPPPVAVARGASLAFLPPRVERRESGVPRPSHRRGGGVEVGTRDRGRGGLPFTSPHSLLPFGRRTASRCLWSTLAGRLLPPRVQVSGGSCATHEPAVVTGPASFNRRPRGARLPRTAWPGS